MHHFYNILKRKFCLSLHSPPNCFCFLQGAAAQPWLVWCQALPLDTRGTGSTLSAGTPGSLLKKWSCLGNHLPLMLHSLAALVLLIPLPCYLLENDSWCLTLLWAEHHGTSAGLWVLVWEAAGPQRSGQAPHTLPCASGDGDRCCPSSSSCSREAPASWDKWPSHVPLLSCRNKGWSEVVLPAGCLVSALPGAQEAPAPVLLSTDDSCTAPTAV